MLTPPCLSPKAEFWYTVGLTGVVLSLHTRFSVHRASRSAHNPKNLWLLLHILVSLVEMFRFQWRARSGLPVQPTPLDFLIFLTHFVSSWQVLAKRTQAGYRDLTPFSLRALALTFRLCASTAALLLGSPLLHRASVKVSADSFLYARLLIFIGQKTRIVSGYKDLYTAAAWLGSLIAVHDFGVPFGPQLHVLGSAAMILLDHMIKSSIRKM